jgi:hypothetical protein
MFNKLEFNGVLWTLSPLRAWCQEIRAESNPIRAFARRRVYQLRTFRKCRSANLCPRNPRKNRSLTSCIKAWSVRPRPTAAIHLMADVIADRYMCAGTPSTDPVDVCSISSALSTA